MEIVRYSHRRTVGGVVRHNRGTERWDQRDACPAALCVWHYLMWTDLSTEATAKQLLAAF